MGRKVFRYRIDLGREPVVVSAHGRTKRGAYYTLGAVRVTRKFVDPDAFADSLSQAFSMLAQAADEKGQ